MRAFVAILLLAGCSGPIADPASCQTCLDACYACEAPQAFQAPDVQAIGAEPWLEWEPSVAVNPDNPDHIVVAFHDDPYVLPVFVADVPGVLEPGSFYLGVLTTFDGGMSWQRTSIPTGIAVPDAGAWNMFCNQGDPITMFHPDGEVLLFGVGVACSDDGLAAAANALFMTRSADGLAWSDPELITVGGGAATIFHDKPWASIERETGRVALAWTAFTHGVTASNLMVAIRDEQGLWEPPSLVRRDGLVEDNMGQGEALVNYYAYPAWTSSGLVIGHRACGGHCVAVAIQDGAGWAIEEVTAVVPINYQGPAFEWFETPMLHAHDRTWTMVTASGEAQKYELSVARSTDAGRTWQLDPVYDPDGLERWHAYTDLDSQGRLHILHLQREPGEPEVQPAYAVWDNGLVLNRSLEEPWHANPGGGLSGLGHYEAIDIAAGRVALAWTWVGEPRNEEGSTGEIFGHDRNVHFTSFEVVP